MAREVLAPRLVSCLINLALICNTVGLKHKIRLANDMTRGFFTYAYHATYISVLILLVWNCRLRLMTRLLRLYDLNSLLFLHVSL